LYSVTASDYDKQELCQTAICMEHDNTSVQIDKNGDGELHEFLESDWEKCLCNWIPQNAIVAGYSEHTEEGWIYWVEEKGSTIKVFKREWWENMENPESPDFGKINTGKPEIIYKISP